MSDRAKERPPITVQSLGARRLTPAGGPVGSGLVWARRASVVALVLAVAWCAAAILRPLPAPDVEPPAPPPAAPALVFDLRPVEERQALVDALAQANYFDSEREFWAAHAPSEASQTARSADDAAAAETIAATPEHGPSMPTGGPAAPGDPIESIRITPRSEAPAHMGAKIAEVRLRGVLGVDGDAAAMISHPRADDSGRLYRVGDTFDDGAWKVLAIQPEKERIILARGDLNIAFSLYDAAPNARPAPGPNQPEPAPVTLITPFEGGPAVEVRTPDEIRAQLAAAGVPPAEIAELLEIAARDAEAADRAQALAEAGDAAPQVGSSETPAAEGAANPAGLAAILRMMQSNPVGAADEKKEQGSGGRRLDAKRKESPRDRILREKESSGGD